MKRIALLIILSLFFLTVKAQEEPLALQIREKVQHEAFTVNALLQSGFRYSLKDNYFQGGRTFEAANARISIRGTIDGQFYYRLFFNLVSEPNLLDAYIGYRYSDAFSVTVGAMKPKQTQDFIPDPGSTDFIDRTRINGLLVQAREVGVAAEGNLKNLWYYAGFFNGTKLRGNNNNQFYGIGRLQYSLPDVASGQLKLGIQGSYGNSPGVRTGSTGPMLRGNRSIYGGDFRYASERWLFAGEYMAGLLETVTFPDRAELISGFYFTAGFQALEKTMFLARWQTWKEREANVKGVLFTLGMNHALTSLTSFQFNFDTYQLDDDDIQYAVSLLLQVQF
ncbi:porin [Roseimarinus sediminis]|uniref:porin n=1 Tax=Roseimarinus sediminis TaxID=1610899 RepID=UPI003D1EFFD5